MGSTFKDDVIHVAMLEPGGKRNPADLLASTAVVSQSPSSRCVMIATVRGYGPDSSPNLTEACHPVAALTRSGCSVLTVSSTSTTISSIHTSRHAARARRRWRHACMRSSPCVGLLLAPPARPAQSPFSDRPFSERPQVFRMVDPGTKNAL